VAQATGTITLTNTGETFDLTAVAGQAAEEFVGNTTDLVLQRATGAAVSTGTFTLSNGAIALTATATPIVQDDIAVQLGLAQPVRFIHGFRRANLAIEVVEVAPSQRAALTRELLGEAGRRPAIVYTPTRKQAASLASELANDFPSEAYHAGSKNVSIRLLQAITTYVNWTGGSAPASPQATPSGIPAAAATAGAVAVKTWTLTYTPGPVTNRSRLATVTYPNQRVLNYVYNPGLDSDISRVSGIPFQGALPGPDVELLDTRQATGTLEVQVSSDGFGPASEWLEDPPLVEVTAANQHLLKTLAHASML